MNLYKIFSFLIFINIIFYSTQANGQNNTFIIERNVLDSLDSDYGYYLAVKPKSNHIKGVVVLLPGFGQKAEDVYRDSELHHFAYENDLLTIAITTGMRMFADTFMQSKLNAILTDVKSTYNTGQDKFVFGGFSAGGRIILRYVERCKQFPKEYPVSPVAIFMADSPVDIFHSWDIMQELKNAANSKIAVDEANWVEKMYLKYYSTTPKESPDLFIQFNPFSLDGKGGEHVQYLKDVAVRAYHDVDISWRLTNRNQSVQHSNYLVTSALINRLLKMGNTKAEFIQSFQTGFRLNGSRHPHSWSIIDEQECIQWIKTIINDSSSTSTSRQTNSESNEVIVYHINSNIKNSDADYFKEIEINWKNYLNSQEYLRRDNIYWNFDEMAFPDYSYISLLMEIRAIVNNNNNPIQCTLMGLIPVKNNYYLLKTMFTQQDEHTKKVDVNHIISVYAKKYDDKYQFINSTQYHKEIYENKKVGDINYIIHPDHDFQEDIAIKMNEFNQTIARLFELEPIKFDYVIANNTTDLGQIIGLDFFSYSYQPVQSGGMADNFNTIIYAGNNSEYYPHEVVHLYTNLKFPRQYHPWVDEGIASLFGGSTGYKLEWHLQKLKAFLANNPEYEIAELSKLETDIPNGEYMTDFRYAISGFLMKKIYVTEGMKGLFEALQAGRNENDYFALLKEKLGIDKSQFEKYIRKEIANLQEISEKELEKLKY